MPSLPFPYLFSTLSVLPTHVNLLSFLQLHFSSHVSSLVAVFLMLSSLCSFLRGSHTTSTYSSLVRPYCLYFPHHSFIFVVKSRLHISCLSGNKSCCIITAKSFSCYFSFLLIDPLSACGTFLLQILGVVLCVVFLPLMCTPPSLAHSRFVLLTFPPLCTRLFMLYRSLSLLSSIEIRFISCSFYS